MSLADNCHRLANTHLTMTEGTPKRVPSLLAQLDTAITTSAHRGTPDSGTSLPISTAAMSLLQDIDREARWIQFKLTGKTGGKLDEIIRGWPRIDWLLAEDDPREPKTTGWVVAITQIVAPTQPPRRLTLPCPACSTLYHTDGKPALQVHCWTPDGALSSPGEWTAECRACEALWDGPEAMAWLIRALESEPTERLPQ